VFRDAVLLAEKDLRLELRSRIALGQIVPFALLVLLLFAFAVDPDRGLLSSLTAGLFWIAVLFSAVLAIQRSFAVESGDGIVESLRMSGLDPAGIFLGKALAITLQLLVVEVVLAFGVTIFYGAELDGLFLLVATALVATTALVAPGTIYGALAAGDNARETILPLLFLPVVAPVLIGATEAFGAALGGSSSEGWSWLALLAVFAVIYTAFGLLAFGSILEET